MTLRLGDIAPDFTAHTTEGAIIDPLQLTARHQVATPVNGKNGEDVIIVPAVSDEAARERFAQGWKAPLSDLRIVPQPGVAR